MCGIAGGYQFQGREVTDLSNEKLASALNRLHHRGPDNQGLIDLGNCILGHVRLKILDLSNDANQPMTEDSRRYHLVFNGEIFNHDALRQQLIVQGETFKTKSDTEVLLKLLIAEGKEALQKLNGFFAFAFFDSAKQILLVALDRFGEKPLYYTSEKGTLYFASELRALQSFGISKEPDIVSLASLLQFTYIPAPATMLQHVKKLEAGSLIQVTSAGVEKIKWYSPKATAPAGDDQQIQKHFRALLSDAVKTRLHADLPACVFLSGGIDSSVIAAISASYNPDIVSFSVTFPDASFFDESKYAKEVASHLRIKNELVPLTEQDMLEEFMLMLETCNEPFADSSAIAFGALARQVSKKMRIALTGDGADELLAGYNKHTALISSITPSLTNTILPLAKPLLDLMPASRNNSLMNKLRQAKRYASILNDNLKERYVKLASWNDATLCSRIIADDTSLRLGARINNYVQDIDPNNLNTILYTDQKLVLANDMLVKADSMSMRHSLEIRSPFLDYRVVEFVNGLDFSLKAKGKKRKILLSETFSKDLPPHVFNRPKRGFEIPLDKWLRGKLKTRTLDTLSSSNLTSKAYLKPNEVDQVLRDYYRNGRSEHAHLIYALLIFEHWYKNLQKS
jgi:asparagine synthase (glutamine-hydrolysing)